MVTLDLSVMSVALGVAIGLAVGLARTFGWRPIASLLAIYVDIMRATPELVLLVWAFFAFPVLTGIHPGPFWTAVTALGIQAGAFISEAVRAGVLSIRLGQIRAGLTLGMTRSQVIRRVVLPQALIRMLPPLGSQVVSTIKGTAIASVIAVPELIRQSQIVANQTFQPFAIYTVIMVIYFMLAFPVARASDRFYQRVAALGAS